MLFVFFWFTWKMFMLGFRKLSYRLRAYKIMFFHLRKGKGRKVTRAEHLCRVFS